MEFFANSIILYTAGFFIVFFAVLYTYFTRNFNFWKNNNIPYVKPIPFLGNFKEVMSQKIDIGHHLQNIHNDHDDKPYVGIFAFDKPALLVRNLELVKNILVRDSNDFFVNRILTLDETVDPMGGKNLFSLKDNKWRYMRGILTPTFTSVKMKNMFQLVNDCGKELNHLIQSSEGSPMQVKDAMARFTTDVMATCAFGVDSNSLRNPNAEFRRVMSTVFQFTLQKALAGFTAFFAPALQSFFRLRLIDEHITTFIRNTVWNTIEYRGKNGISRKDFMDSIKKLIEKENLKKSGSIVINTQGNTFKLDGDDFVAQAYIFLAAGFEPASTTLSFALYELCFNPNVQKKIRKEIMETMSKYNHELSYDAVQELHYLDMVISETLRKYPAVPFLDRIAAKDYPLPSPNGTGNVVLKAGTGVYISVLGIHNDPLYYSEPESFEPERFTEEQKRNRPHSSFIPFGDGPRTCIGMRFGLLMVKVGLIHILSNFEVEPCKNTPIPLNFDPKPFLLATEGEIPLLFKKIKESQGIGS